MTPKEKEEQYGNYEPVRPENMQGEWIPITGDNYPSTRQIWVKTTNGAVVPFVYTGADISKILFNNHTHWFKENTQP